MPIGFRGPQVMFSHPKYRRWVARIGLLASLLWVAQLAAGWHTPFGDGKYTQRGELPPAQIIESERGGSGGACKPDRKSEPWSVAPPDATPAPRRFRVGIIPGSPAITDRAPAVALPAIRAPPTCPTAA